MLAIFRTDPNRTQFYCNKSTLFWCHGRLVFPGGSCKKCRYFRPICIICDNRDVYILILLLPLFVFYKLLKRCFKKYILDYSRNVQIFHKFGTLKTRIHHHSDNINARNSQKMSLDWGNIFISLHPPQNFATLALSEGNLHQDPTGTHRHFPLSWKSSLRIAQTLSQLILHLLLLSHWDMRNCSQKLHISLQFIESATFLPGLLHWTQLQSSLSSHRFCYVPIKSQHVRRTHHGGTFASIYTKPGRASPAVSIDTVAIEDFCVDCFTEEHEVESMPFLLFFACVRVERQSDRFLVCFLLPRDEPVLTLGSFYSQRRSCNKIYKYYWLKFILQAIRQNQTKRIKAKTTNSGDLLSQNQSKIEKQTKLNPKLNGAYPISINDGIFLQSFKGIYGYIAMGLHSNKYQIDQILMDSIHSADYYIDIGNSTIYNTPVAFSSKYPQLEHYQKIIDDQHNFQQLMYKMISNEHSQNQQIDIPALIKESGFDEESSAIIGQVLKIKYNQYKKELIKRQMFQGGSYLANFNWKIKNVVGCSEFTHKNRIILKLQLTICKGKRANQVDTIALELGISQARELLNKLKQISKQMKNTN